MDIQLIVAMTKNNVIGKNGTLPWKINEDLQLFKEKTLGATVIMGENTWNSLPAKIRPMPGRNNIILSPTLPPQNGAIVCKSIEEAISEAKKANKEIFCVGGARVYGAMLPFVNVLHISWIKENYPGDILFPKINFEEWEEVESKEYAEFVHKKYIRKEKVKN